MSIVERVREVLSYDSGTGAFTWRVAKRGLAAGMQAGTVTGGYRQIQIDGKLYKAHRLAWLLAHGCWPAGDIDHINGEPSDNRIANLRDVPRRVNRENQRKPHADSKTKVLGVCAYRGRYVTRIKSAGRRIHIGTFDTPAEAQQAYLDAKRAMHEGCTL